jgi:hypothetical protein
MHEDAVLRMRQALADVWDSGGRRFVTIEDVVDDAYFLQYVDGQLNVAWPFESEPELELEDAGVELPDGVSLLSWAPRGTLILAVGDLLLDDVVDLVENLLDRVLEVDDVAVRIDSDR